MKHRIGSCAETWMDLASVTQSEISQTEKNKYRILMHICASRKKKTGTDDLICKAEIETQRRKVCGGGMNWEIETEHIYTIDTLYKIEN